jgi:hypothetical protein
MGGRQPRLAGSSEQPDGANRLHDPGEQGDDDAGVGDDATGGEAEHGHLPEGQPPYGDDDGPARRCAENDHGRSGSQTRWLDVGRFQHDVDPGRDDEEGTDPAEAGAPSADRCAEDAGGNPVPRQKQRDQRDCSSARHGPAESPPHETVMLTAVAALERNPLAATKLALTVYVPTGSDDVVSFASSGLDPSRWADPMRTVCPFFVR